MISTVNHVSFTVSNLEESIEFYKNVLGLELISLAERDEAFSAAVTGVPKAKMNIAYMKAANCSIELIQYVQAGGERLDTHTNNIGSAHVCFNIRDYDEWMERMKKNHVSFRGELCHAPADQIREKEYAIAWIMMEIIWNSWRKYDRGLSSSHKIFF